MRTARPRSSSPAPSPFAHRRAARRGDAPTGWIALSETMLRKAKPASRFAFLDGVPYTMVGKSIRLYYRAP